MSLSCRMLGQPAQSCHARGPVNPCSLHAHTYARMHGRPSLCFRICHSSCTGLLAFEPSSPGPWLSGQSATSACMLQSVCNNFESVLSIPSCSMHVLQLCVPATV